MIYFGKNIKFLREQSGIKQAEMLTVVGFNRTTWNNYETGKSFPKFEDLLKIAKYFDVNETDLIHKNLFQPSNLTPEKTDTKTIKVRGKVRGIERDIDVNESFLPKSQGNIVIIDSKAAAGMAALIDSPQVIDQLPSFSLPLMATRNGSFVCIEITGDSMHPTIKDREWVIAERISDVDSIKNGFIHVIVAQEGTVCKRLYHEQGKDYIKLVSDNETYTSYRQPLTDVVAIYKSIMKLSYDFRNWNNDMRKELRDIKDRIANLEAARK